VTRAATVDSAGPPDGSPTGRRITPAGSPDRSDDTNETNNGKLTSSQAAPAAARYSHHRDSAVAYDRIVFGEVSAYDLRCRRVYDLM
jgi:hypothetical protein